jgi:hypothetical protein
MPWLVGSAAVFGSAFAFLAMSGSDKHAAHAVHEGTTHMKEYHASPEKPKSHEDAVATQSGVGVSTTSVSSYAPEYCGSLT